MLALFLAVTSSAGTLDAFDDHLISEHRAAIFVLLLMKQLELHAHTVLLCPFQEFRLEINLFISHLIDVDELTEDALLHKAHASIVTTVKINGTNKCLKGVATHVAVMTLVATCRNDKVIDAHLLGQTAKRLALYEFRAGVGKESFAFAWEMLEHNITHDGIKDGVAQEF